MANDEDDIEETIFWGEPIEGHSYPEPDYKEGDEMTIWSPALPDMGEGIYETKRLTDGEWVTVASGPMSELIEKMRLEAEGENANQE